MLVRMTEHGPGGRMPAPTALIAVAGSLSAAIAAVQAGADLIDLTGLASLSDPGDLGGGAGPADHTDPDDAAERDTIEELRARCRGVLVCGTGQTADLVRDPAVALASGALLICGDIEAARASGLPRHQVLVEMAPGAVLQAAQAGWATLVDVDRTAELAAGRRTDGSGGDYSAADHSAAAAAGIVAAAALCSWLGAAAVRTRHPVQVGRALEMTASIAGTRPPARTVRGLA